MSTPDPNIRVFETRVIGMTATTTKSYDPDHVGNVERSHYLCIPSEAEDILDSRLAEHRNSNIVVWTAEIGYGITKGMLPVPWAIVWFSRDLPRGQEFVEARDCRETMPYQNYKGLESDTRPGDSIGMYFVANEEALSRCHHKSSLFKGAWGALAGKKPVNNNPPDGWPCWLVIDDSQ